MPSLNFGLPESTDQGRAMAFASCCPDDFDGRLGLCHIWSKGLPLKVTQHSTGRFMRSFKVRASKSWFVCGPDTWALEHVILRSYHDNWTTFVWRQQIATWQPDLSGSPSQEAMHCVFEVTTSEQCPQWRKRGSTWIGRCCGMGGFCDKMYAGLPTSFTILSWTSIHCINFLPGWICLECSCLSLRGIRQTTSGGWLWGG